MKSGNITETYPEDLQFVKEFRSFGYILSRILKAILYPDRISIAQEINT